MKKVSLKHAALKSAACFAIGAFAQGCMPQSVSTTSKSVSSKPASSPARSSSPSASAATSGEVSGSGGTVCPAGFVKVPANADYAQKDFCVAKYEMKKGADGKPVSEAAGSPWTNREIDQSLPVSGTVVEIPLGPPGSIGASLTKKVDNAVNRDSAEQLCKSMGEGYDLITNAQWQTIARNVVGVGTNWSSGKANSGEINSGLFEEAVDLKTLPAGSDDQPCINSKANCTRTSWARSKRTHTLSNGEVVWDLAGNAGEVMKDTFSFGRFIATYLEDIGQAKVDALRNAGYVVSYPKEMGIKPGAETPDRSLYFYDVTEMRSQGYLSSFSEDKDKQRELLGALPSGTAGKTAAEVFPETSFDGGSEAKLFGSKTLCEGPGKAPYCGFGRMSLGHTDGNKNAGIVYQKQVMNASDLTVETLKKLKDPGVPVVRGKVRTWSAQNEVCKDPSNSQYAAYDCANTISQQGIFTVEPMASPGMDASVPNPWVSVGFRCVYNK